MGPHRAQEYLHKSFFAVRQTSLMLCFPQAISLEFNGKYDRHQIRDRWHGQAEKQMFRHLGYWKEDEKERLLEVRAYA